MTDAFYGEITMSGVNFTQESYTLCMGQVLPISQNSALFSIIGDIYGGDGRVTFGIPNLKGRAPIHVGGIQNSGPGLTLYRLGWLFGQTDVTLTADELPIHSHGLINIRKRPETDMPSSTTIPSFVAANAYYSTTCTSNTFMSESAVSIAGASKPHENRQPYTVVNYSMCIDGIYPSRN